MLRTFEGGGKIVDAYDAVLTEPQTDLVVIKRALGASTIDAVAAAAKLYNTDLRVSRLQEILQNELPLDRAEGLIADWSSTLPSGLKIFPSLEAPVGERVGATSTHFDHATADNPTVYGPFAISIGTAGQGLFRGKRLPYKLTDAQLLGDESAMDMRLFEDLHTHNGKFKGDVLTANVIQEPGDIVLIPGSPQPSLHSVEVERGPERKSVIGSYIMTDTEHTPRDLRSLHYALVALGALGGSHLKNQ